MVTPTARSASACRRPATPAPAMTALTMRLPERRSGARLQGLVGGGDGGVDDGVIVRRTDERRLVLRRRPVLAAAEQPGMPAAKALGVGLHGIGEGLHGTLGEEHRDH